MKYIKYGAELYHYTLFLDCHFVNPNFSSLFQYGLMDIADFDGTDDNFGDDEDDDDLEAELLALTSGGGQKKPAAKSTFDCFDIYDESYL